MEKIEKILQNVKKQLELRMITKEKAVEILTDVIFKSKCNYSCFKRLDKGFRNYFLRKIRECDANALFELCEIIIKYNKGNEVRVRRFWNIVR